MCAKTDDVQCFIKLNKARDFKIDLDLLRSARERAADKQAKRKAVRVQGTSPPLLTHAAFGHRILCSHLPLACAI